MERAPPSRGGPAGASFAATRKAAAGRGRGSIRDRRSRTSAGGKRTPAGAAATGRGWRSRPPAPPGDGGETAGATPGAAPGNAGPPQPPQLLLQPLHLLLQLLEAFLHLREAAHRVGRLR